MNVLILALNAKFSHSCLAAYCLKTALLAEAVSAEVYEATINDSIYEIICQVAEKRPDRLLFPLYIWNTIKALSIAADLRLLLPDTVFIAGGPEAEANREEIARLHIFDVIARGECEKGIAELVVSAEQRLDETMISQLPLPEFSILPFPYTSSDLSGLSRRIAYYESIRGCPFSCGYCLSGSSETARKKLSFKAVESVVNDLQNFLSHPPGMVKFVDRSFNIHRDHTHAIWNFLLSLPSDAPELTFQFELHPGLINDEDIRLLSQLPPGRVQLEIGIQSLNAQVLGASGRSGQEDWPSIRENLVRLNRLSNIRTHLDQIIGLPYSDRKEVISSMEDILSTRPGYFQPGFLKVLKGTDFDRKSEEYGFIRSQAPPYGIYATHWLSIEDIREFHEVEWAIDALYNSGSFPSVLDYVTERQAFSFYREFSRRHALKSPGGKQGRQWEHLAATIGEMYADTADAETIHDLLMRDWCRRAPSWLYPDGIGAPSRKELEAERLIIWKQIKKSGFSGLPDGFSMRLYNRSILYLPKTAEGRAKAGGEKILFIPVDAVKIPYIHTPDNSTVNIYAP